MDKGKAIATLNALVALGVDEASAARVVRDITRDANAIQKRLDMLNATKAQKSMDQWAASIREAGGVQKLTEDQTRRLVTQVEKLAQAGAKVPIALQPAIDSVNKLRAAEASAAEASALKSGLLNKAGLGSLAGMGPAAGVLMATGAMAGAAKETFDLINSTATLGDEIQDLATKYQISTDAVQEFQFMAARTGVSVDDFGAAIVTLSKNMDVAPEKFKAWGMDVEHLKSLQPAELLGEMSKKLETLNESDRLTFAKELMKGVELLPALLGGFDELAAKAKELGINLSQADITSLNGLRDSLDDIGTAWEGMWVQLGAALAQDAGVQEFFATLRDGIVELAAVIKDNKNEIVGFAKMMAGWYTLNPVLIAKGAGQALGVSGNTGGASGSWGDPLPKDKVPDQRENAALKAAAANREEQARKALEAKIEAENAWYLAGLKNAEESAKAAKAVQKWVSEELIKLSSNVTRMLSPGAEEAARLQALNAPPGTLNAAALEALGVHALSTPRNAFDQSKPKQWDLVSPPKLSEVEKVRTSWSQFLQDTANQFQLMGKSGQAIGKILGGIGGLGSHLQAASGPDSSIGKWLSGPGGEKLKQANEYVAAALAAIDMGKLLLSMFHKTEAQKVMFDVGRDYGVKISEGLAKAIAENSKTMGREAASLLSLDKIVGEAGGVQAFGVDKTVAKMRDLFSMIETGKMTADQAKGPFDKLFGEVAQASISKTTGLISMQVRELMALNAASGMKSDAVEAFRNQQRDIAQTILDRLTGNKEFTIANAQAGAALGASFAAQYRRMVEQGLSGKEIADKLGGLLEKLQAKFDESGFGGGAAFDQALSHLALYQDELTGPTAQSIQDVTALATALYNSGDLTRDQFAGLAGQIGQDFATLQTQLAEQGRAPAEAFGLMAGDLQKLWELQRRYGATLDAETQSILDQAEASGTVGEAQMSAQDRMAEGIERLGEIMQRTGEALGASFDDLPSRARSAAMGVNDALAGIAPPDLSGGLNLPRDMSAYGAPSGGGAAAALQALLSGASPSGQPAAPIELSAESIAALAGALLGQPIQLSVSVPIDGDAIVGRVQTRIERGMATSLVTAIENKLNERG